VYTPPEAAVPAIAAKVYYDGKNTFVNSSVQFRLSSKDNVALDKIEYRINNSGTKVYDKPFIINAEGKNVISFYGVDKIGNKEDVKIYTVIVDNSTPDVIVKTDKPVAKANDKLYVSKIFNFSIESKDALSGLNKVDFSINEETKEYVTPFNIVADGEVILKVKAVDNVNNPTDQFTLKYVDANGKEELIKAGNAKIYVDNSAPSVNIVPDKDLKIGEYSKKLAAPDAKYAITATDDGSGIDGILVRVDGEGDFLPYFNEIKFKNNGEHTIEAKAIDKVGNISTVSTLSVFVDTVAPDTKVDTIPE
jgi:hypothetical protein